MPSIKVHPGVSQNDFVTNVIASEIASRSLTDGSRFLPLREFTDQGIRQAEIFNSLEKLRNCGLLQILEGADLDASEIDGLQIHNLTLNVSLRQSTQKQLDFNGKSEFGEGTKDHKIGHAIYRGKVSIAESEENETTYYAITIDRYTIHSDHLTDETPTVFSKVRHVLNEQKFPTTEAAWKFFDDYCYEKEEREDDGRYDRIFVPNSDGSEIGYVYELHVIEDGSCMVESAQVVKVDRTTEVLISEKMLFTMKDAYTFWEEALDDLYPATMLASESKFDGLEVPTDDTEEVAHPSLTDPEDVEVSGELSEWPEKNPCEFSVTVNGIAYSVRAARLKSADTIKATYFDADGKTQIKEVKITKDRPVSGEILRNQVEAWLAGGAE